MRISDWSSDVCSSDLPYPPADQMSYRQARSGGAVHPPVRRRNYPSMRTRHSFPRQAREHGHVSCWRITACGPARPLLRWLDDRSRLAPLPLMAATACRSEEHTSELQSLMRISYAVFCLKKKK